MKNLAEFFTSFIPFIAPYPIWVKGLVGAWVFLSALILIAFIFARPKSKSDSQTNRKRSSKTLETYEFKLLPKTRKIDTGIDVSMGEYITGHIDLSNPFYIDTQEEFPWTSDFRERYKNQGKWIGPIKYISPSGMKTYDNNGQLVKYDYPDVVFETWGSIYLQVEDKKYRIEKLSIKNSLINEPPNTIQPPLLMEVPGRLFIYVNPHPYLEGTKGEVIIQVNKSI